MSNSGGPSGSWTRCICSVCSGHLEFDSDLAGETIQCPHCGMPTILFIPRIPLPIPAGRISAPKVLVCPDCGTPADTDAHACAGCGRVIERLQPALRADLPQPGTGLSPTAAGAWLVMAILLVVVVGGPIYWSCSQFAQVPKPETELQLTSRLQSEAELEMLKESTNVIVGLNRIIRVSVSNRDENPYRWAGEVVAEFVNRVGGVERTNIFFKFGTDTGSDGLVHLRCGVESEAEHRARQRTDRR
jgi:DNA-directed RNA polymerase subunit RPC12/RpoP